MHDALTTLMPVCVTVELEVTPRFLEATAVIIRDRASRTGHMLFIESASQAQRTVLCRFVGIFRLLSPASRQTVDKIESGHVNT